MTARQGDGFIMPGAAEGPTSFSALVLGLASTVLIHLGQNPHPEGTATEVNLPLARQTVDLLVVLQEKTRGNLTDDENRLLVSILTDLRMRVVQVHGKAVQ